MTLHRLDTRTLDISGGGDRFPFVELSSRRLPLTSQEEEIVSLLLEFGADVDQFDFYKTTALHKACAIDSAACIQALVKGRPNPASKVSEDDLQIRRVVRILVLRSGGRCLGGCFSYSGLGPTTVQPSSVSL